MRVKIVENRTKTSTSRKTIYKCDRCGVSDLISAHRVPDGNLVWGMTLVKCPSYNKERLSHHLCDKCSKELQEWMKKGEISNENE